MYFLSSRNLDGRLQKHSNEKSTDDKNSYGAKQVSQDERAHADDDARRQSSLRCPGN